MNNLNCPKCGRRSTDASMTWMPSDGTSPTVKANCLNCWHKWTFRADDADLEDMKIQVVKRERCAWTVDEDGTWKTGCDNLFQFEVDGPHENHFRFCPYCGKPLEAVHAPD